MRRHSHSRLVTGPKERRECFEWFEAIFGDRFDNNRLCNMTITVESVEQDDKGAGVLKKETD